MESTTQNSTSTNTPPIKRTKTAHLNEVQASLCAERKALADELRRLDDRKKAIDAQMKALLEQRGAKIGVFGGRVVVELQHYAKRLIDTKAFKEMDPEYAETFVKVSEGESIHYL